MSVPEIKLNIERISLTPRTGKLEYGKFPVCQSCGKLVNNYVDGPNAGKPYPCCNNQKVGTLRQYVEEVRKEKFEEEKWSMITEDIVCVKDIDLTAEITTFNGIQI